MGVLAPEPGGEAYPRPNLALTRNEEEVPGFMICVLDRRVLRRLHEAGTLGCPRDASRDLVEELLPLQNAAIRLQHFEEDPRED